MTFIRFATTGTTASLSCLSPGPVHRIEINYDLLSFCVEIHPTHGYGITKLPNKAKQRRRIRNREYLNAKTTTGENKELRTCGVHATTGENKEWNKCCWRIVTSKPGERYLLYHENYPYFVVITPDEIVGMDDLRIPRMEKMSIACAYGDENGLILGFVNGLFMVGNDLFINGLSGMKLISRDNKDMVVVIQESSDEKQQVRSLVHILQGHQCVNSLSLPYSVCAVIIRMDTVIMLLQNGTLGFIVQDEWIPMLIIPSPEKLLFMESKISHANFHLCSLEDGWSFDFRLEKSSRQIVLLDKPRMDRH